MSRSVRVKPSPVLWETIRAERIRVPVRPARETPAGVRDLAGPCREGGSHTPMGMGRDMRLAARTRAIASAPRGDQRLSLLLEAGGEHLVDVTLDGTEAGLGAPQPVGVGAQVAGHPLESVCALRVCGGQARE